MLIFRGNCFQRVLIIRDRQKALLELLMCEYRSQFTYSSCEINLLQTQGMTDNKRFTMGQALFWISRGGGFIAPFKRIDWVGEHQTIPWQLHSHKRK